MGEEFEVFRFKFQDRFKLPDTAPSSNGAAASSLPSLVFSRGDEDIAAVAKASEQGRGRRHPVLSNFKLES